LVHIEDHALELIIALIMAIVAEFILRKARGKPIFERLKKPEFSLQNVLDSLKIDMDADSYRAEKKNFIPINQMVLTLEKNGENLKTATFDEIFNVFQDTRNRLFFITGSSLSGKTYFAAQILEKMCEKNGKCQLSIAAPKNARDLYTNLVENFNKVKNTKYDSLEDIFNSLEKSEILDVWIDIDRCLHGDIVDKTLTIIKDIEEDAKEKARLFIISSENLAEKIKTKLSGIEETKSKNIITTKIEPLNTEKVVKIVSEKLNIKNSDYENIIRLLETILGPDKENKQRFEKIPYIYALIKTFEEHGLYAINKKINELNGEADEKVFEIIACNIIIAACKRLRDVLKLKEELKKDKELEKYGDDDLNFRIERSSIIGKKAEFASLAPPTALDFEYGYIVRRKIEGEATKKLRKEEENQTLLLSGLSGSGKTALALKLGYEKWKDGQIIVYAPCIKVEERIIREVLEEVNRPTMLILDDIHLTPENFSEIVRGLSEYNFVKIIATSRASLKEIKQASEVAQSILEGKVAPEEIKIKKESFEEGVQRILETLEEKGDIKIKGDSEEIGRNIIEKTKNCFYLVKFLLRKFLEEKTELTPIEIKSQDTCDFIRYYTNSISKEIGIKDIRAKNELAKALYYGSIFFQYEIPVLEDMMMEKGIQDWLLNDMIRVRELIRNEEFIAGKYYNFLTIPHSNLGISYQICFTAYRDELKINEVEEFINLLLKAPHVLGTNTTKLLKYNKNLLTKIVEKIEEKNLVETIKNNFKTIELKEINLFLTCLWQVNKEVMKSIFEDERVISLIFDEKKMKEATLGDIGWFFKGSLVGVSKEFFKNLTKNTRVLTAINYKFKESSLRDIEHFFNSLTLAPFFSKTLVEYQEIVKTITFNLKEEKLWDITSFFEGLAEIRKEVAKILARNEGVIIAISDENKFKEATLGDICSFFNGLVGVNKEIVNSIAEKKWVIKTIENKFKEAKLRDIGSFFNSLAWANLEVARKIAEEQEVIAIMSDDDKFQEAILDDIEWFFKSLVRVSKKVAESISENRGITRKIGDKFKEITLSDIGWFFKRLAKMSVEVAKNIAEDEEVLTTINNKFKEVTIGAIGWFFKSLEKKEIAKTIAENPVIVITISDENKFKEATLWEIGSFFHGLAWANLEVAGSIVEDEGVITTISDENKFKEAKLGDISTFFNGLSRISLKVAKIIAEDERIIKIIEDKLKKSTLVDIGWFFQRLSKEEILKSIVENKEINNTVSDENKFKEATLGDISIFFQALAKQEVVKIIAKDEEIITTISDENKFKEAKLKDIGRFFKDLSEGGFGFELVILDIVENFLEKKIVEYDASEVSEFFKGFFLGTPWKLPGKFACLLLKRFKEEWEAKDVYEELIKEFKCSSEN